MKTLLMTGALLLAVLLTGCGEVQAEAPPGGTPESELTMEAKFTVETPIQDVMTDPAFGDYGRLLFPVNDRYYSGETLGDLQLTYYSHIDPNETVAIVNDLKDHALAGDTVFYNIYTEEEKAADPEKADTGLFFFKGEPGAKFAVCNPRQFSSCAGAL